MVKREILSQLLADRLAALRMSADAVCALHPIGVAFVSAYTDFRRIVSMESFRS